MVLVHHYVRCWTSSVMTSLIHVDEVIIGHSGKRFAVTNELTWMQEWSGITSTRNIGQEMTIKRWSSLAGQEMTPKRTTHRATKSALPNYFHQKGPRHSHHWDSNDIKVDHQEQYESPLLLLMAFFLLPMSHLKSIPCPCPRF